MHPDALDIRRNLEPSPDHIMIEVHDVNEGCDVLLVNITNDNQVIVRSFLKASMDLYRENATAFAAEVASVLDVRVLMDPQLLQALTR